MLFILHKLDKAELMEKHSLDPIRRPALGWIVFSVGLVMMLAAGGIAFVDQSTEDALPDIYILWVVLLFGVGGWMTIRGRRLKAKPGEKLLQEDDRPPIIYLRSFDRENRDNTPRNFFSVLFSRQISNDIPAWGPTEQWLLGKYLQRMGPYVAIGEPGEKLPEVGAAKLYVSDADWQERVVRFLKEAQLVVVRVGTSKGLFWEIDQIIRYVPPTKLLLILPTRKKDYKVFRALADGVFPRPLPEVKRTVRLLTFDLDWNPVPLIAKGQLPETLAPYLLQNGITPPSKGSWRDQWFGIYK
jgi:hypothetical protein